MTIETKYNIGDEVWFMEDNKPVRAEVYGVDMYIEKGKSLFIYRVRCVNLTRHDKWEQKLFPTKEELLNSLKHE